ncbi:MAG: YraN family protein [Ruminococcus sp.]|nr:YraN family protein [Ruminococcus sp.]
MNNNETGRLGENAVCRYLTEKGYVILKRNYRIRGGEIDIIAEKEGYIAFVEVKTRSINSISDGFDAIDARKMRAVIKTAENYLNKYPTQLQPRFDAAQVTVSGGDAADIEYVTDAFDII